MRWSMNMEMLCVVKKDCQGCKKFEFSSNAAASVCALLFPKIPLMA